MRIALLLAVITWSGVASAQEVDRRYAEEPTGGLALPATPLAGEHDARAVTVNPGGMSLLRGPELALALDLEDEDVATTAGPGFGAYFATPVGGGILPRFSFGAGFEWLRPARSQLAPDPGTPFRLTMSLGLGSFGVAWHHFVDDGGALDGRDTFDLGYSSRFGNHLAIGAVVRDLATPSIAGTPIQRRYELETLVRPLATDRLELAIGGRIGETREDLDGWGRVSVRAARGLYVTANVESRELFALDSSPMGIREDQERELRATLGFDVSFGDYGVGLYGTGVRDSDGNSHALGSTLVLRVQSLGPASILGPTEHIERVEVSGEITTRELTTLVLRLRSIARDPSVKAVLLVFDGAEAGWATLQELRLEALNVRKAGKKVFAYMVAGGGRDYYVASVADKIYMDPAGALRLMGIAGATFYFRGAFDMVGVQPQFEKIAEYKSAPEQFTNREGSAPARQMYDDIYDSLWDQWAGAIAEGRHLRKEDIKAIVDAGPYSAGDLAKDTRLIDAVATPEKISDLIVKELGQPYGVSVSEPTRPERWERPGVAIIYVDGDITDGKSQSIPLLGRSFAGGETVIDAIAKARKDPDVRAIVLRIDSPGGSALASELISREVFATRGVKPIVCSMSNLAASGGYFVAAGCDVIYAEPMTLTGSIGIFYGKFDVSGLLAKLGISIEMHKRGVRADAESFFRPFTPDERAAMLDQLRYMYSRFVGAVSEGRKLSKDDVDAVGRGHVYTGVQAQPIKLVDRFGGLADALDDAKHRMGLSPSDKVTIYELPRTTGSFLDALGGLVGARVPSMHAPSVTDLPIVQQMLRGLPASMWMAPTSAQARLPYDFIWE